MNCWAVLDRGFSIKFHGSSDLFQVNQRQSKTWPTDFLGAWCGAVWWKPAEFSLFSPSPWTDLVGRVSVVPRVNEPQKQLRWNPSSWRQENQVVSSLQELFNIHDFSSGLVLNFRSSLCRLQQTPNTSRGERLICCFLVPLSGGFTGLFLCDETLGQIQSLALVLCVWGESLDPPGGAGKHRFVEKRLG